MLNSKFKSEESPEAVKLNALNVQQILGLKIACWVFIEWFGRDVLDEVV